MPLGGMEIMIVLLVVVVLFGAGRISRLGGELGSGIREFRRGLQADDNTSTIVTEADKTTKSTN